MRILAHLQFRFAPAKGVVADADGSHAGQRRKAHLQVLVVTAIGPMSVGTDDDRIAAIPGGHRLLGNLVGRHVNRTAHIIPGQSFKRDVLHGIAIISAHLAQNRPDGDTFFEQWVDAEALTHFTAQGHPSDFPLFLVAVERIQVVDHLLAILVKSARVFVGLDLIDALPLVPGLEVEDRKNVSQGLVEAIGTDARIGIVQDQPCGIDIVLEAHAKPLLDLIEHFSQGTRHLVIGSQRVCLCYCQRKCGSKQ